MKKQHFAFILGGAWLAGMSVIASMSACSGDTTPTDSGPKDSTAKDVVTNDVVTQDQNNPDVGPQDAGPDCKNVPTGAPFTTDSGPFCPFGGDGSTFAPCPQGDHCCLPGSGNSTCSTGACVFATDASSNSDFQCNETNDCTTGQVCCENAGSQIQQDLGCTQYDFVSKQHGTTCIQTSCPAGQAQICGSNADCPTGKTCFPVNTKAMWLGVCISSDGGI